VESGAWMGLEGGWYVKLIASGWWNVESGAWMGLGGGWWMVEHRA